MSSRYKEFHKVLCENGGGDFPESFTQNLHRIITRMKEASKKDGFEAAAAAFDEEVTFTGVIEIIYGFQSLEHALTDPRLSMHKNGNRIRSIDRKRIFS